MAYSDFTLKSASRAFGLRIEDQGDLHADVPETEVRPFLREMLEETVPLALAIHTKKARGELIVAPVLAEVRRRTRHRVSLFSGIVFDVAPELGLNGVCDFLLAHSSTQLFLESPALTVVEANDDNINSGLGQCVAEMVAARMFNEKEGRGPSIINGLVTTGSLWKFLRLDGATVSVDGPEYPISRLGKIMAILLHCVRGNWTRESGGGLSPTGEIPDALG